MLLESLLLKFSNKKILAKVCNVKQLRYYQRPNIKPKHAIKVLIKYYENWRYDLAIQDIWQVIIKGEKWT